MMIFLFCRSFGGMSWYVGDDIAFDTSIDKIASANAIAVRF